MAESKVQLKREEIVGDEVVLTDIDPKTSTSSVNDDATGLGLDETLARLWSAVNNKLARVTNSVNGRTGVVVLTAKDVGLENVDNVSFSQIQDWTLDQLEQEFSARSFKIYETLDEAIAAGDTQDQSLSGAGFFSKYGLTSANDKKSYIGHFVWDGTGLVVSYMSLNNIGSTDNSLLYDQKIGDRDYRGGKLGLNIWKDEDALEVYNGTIDETGEEKSNAGLRIVRENLLPSTTYFEGCYGSDKKNPGEAADSWLYVDGTAPEGAVRVDITYDDQDISNAENPIYAQKVFKKGDIIICNFSSMYVKLYRRTTSVPYSPDRDPVNIPDPNHIVRPVEFPTGVNERLMDRHAAHGIVDIVTMNDDNDVVSYHVTFHPFKQNVMGGLAYVSDYGLREDYLLQDGYGYNDIGGNTQVFGTYRNDAIIIRLPAGAVTTDYLDSRLADVKYRLALSDNDINDHDKLTDEFLNVGSETIEVYSYSKVKSKNVSGLTVRENPIRTFMSNDKLKRTSDSFVENVTICGPQEIRNNWRFTNLPAGPYPSFDPRFNSNTANYGGIEILPDASLCVIPASSYMSSENHTYSHKTYKGSEGAANWRANADFYIPDQSMDVKRRMIDSNTALGGECLLGINLNKVVVKPTGKGIPILANMSGLRIFNPGEIPEELGGNSPFQNANDAIYNASENTKLTGGIAINCGKYLKIEPPTLYQNADQFYDGGKLTLDIDLMSSGLEEDDDGKLVIALGMGKGLKKYTDTDGVEKLGVDLKDSPICFDSYGGLSIKTFDNGSSTGLRLIDVELTTAQKNNYSANGIPYTVRNGRYYTTAIGVAPGDGITINAYNKTCAKIYTLDANSKRVAHGLTFFNETNTNLTANNTGAALGIQIEDPDTHMSHGLTINEKGTLCVDLSTNGSDDDGGDGTSGSFVNEVLANMDFKTWQISGNEIITINGIETGDVSKKVYEYNPKDEQLQIKLGKGLIFVDERGASDSEDEDGCGCPGCKCNYCDYVVDMPGKETYEILEWIESDGTQRIDTNIAFEKDNYHIFAPSYIEKSTNDQMVFEVGRHMSAGSQYFGLFGGVRTLGVIDSSEDAVQISQKAADSTIAKTRKFVGGLTYTCNYIRADWIYYDTTQTDITEDHLQASCDVASLSCNLLSIFGTSVGGNDSLNAKIKLYGFKVFMTNGSSIIADLIPVKCISGANKGLVGLFDKCTNTFYSNTAKINGVVSNFIAGETTGDQIDAKGNSIGSSDPAKLVTYKELRWIKPKDGTNSKITINDIVFEDVDSAHIIEPDFTAVSLLESVDEQVIVSVGDGTEGTQKFSINNGTKTLSVVDQGTTHTLSQNADDVDMCKVARFKGYVSFENDRLYANWSYLGTDGNPLSGILDEEAENFTRTTDAAVAPLTIFNVFDGDEDTNAHIRLYRVKIYEESKMNLIADLVPVESSNKRTGLLDIVNGKFYPNDTADVEFEWNEVTGYVYNYKGELVTGE